MCGIDETAEQGWKGYAVSVLVMAVVAIVVGYVVLRLQDVLPLNPNGASPQIARTWPSTPRSASRPTPTGRTTRARPGVSYLSQMLILAVRNFTSAATGLAVAIALIRGLTRRSAKTIGNYWVDLTRGILYISCRSLWSSPSSSSGRACPRP